MARPEYVMHHNLKLWMDAVWPDIYYRSDLAGMSTGINQAKMAKSLQKYRGHPDFQVIETINAWPGLFLELKPGMDEVFLKKGGLPAQKASHLLEQAAMILYLRQKGYVADLVIGQEQAEQIINAYLEGRFDTTDYTGNVEAICEQASREQIRQAALEHGLVYDFIA